MNKSMLSTERGVAAALPPVWDKPSRPSRALLSAVGNSEVDDDARVWDKPSRPSRALLSAVGDSEADDDARVWDTMGRVVFSAGSGNAPNPPVRDQFTSMGKPQSLPIGGGEADTDARVWDTMGRIVFPPV
jgi:hypothetical protein